HSSVELPRRAQTGLFGLSKTLPSEPARLSAGPRLQSRVTGRGTSAFEILSYKPIVAVILKCIELRGSWGNRYARSVDYGSKTQSWTSISTSTWKSLKKRDRNRRR